MDAESIDRVDLTILMVLEDAGEPLWKKSVHRYLAEFAAVPDRISDVSVQTVGRRIDRLHENGLLAPSIVTPEDINRDLIIAYQITETGRTVLQRKREDILRQHVSTPQPLEAPAEAETVYVAELFADELGLDADGRELLKTSTDTELAALIAAYYLHHDIDDAIAQEQVDTLSRIGGRDDRLDAVVEWIINLGD